MTITLTASFHGGKTGLNNLYSFQQGSSSGSAILDVTLDELRGFTLGPHGNLYVAVAHRGSDSNVLSFTPPTQSGGQYTNGTAFVSPQSKVAHPFALVFAGANLFVSNQDDNKIRQFDASTGDYIQDFSDDFNVLRGLTTDNVYLYAADEQGGKNKAGEVSWYLLPTSSSPTKASKVGHVDVADAVHIMYDGLRYVYIGSEEQKSIYLLDTQNLNDNGLSQLKLPSSPNLTDVCGLAIATDSDSTYLFVGDRKGKQIVQYTLDTSSDPPTVTGHGSVFVEGLSDDPEFVSALGISGAVSG
jgi:hypothetical protein